MAIYFLRGPTPPPRSFSGDAYMYDHFVSQDLGIKLGKWGCLNIFVLILIERLTFPYPCIPASTYMLFYKLKSNV